MKPQSVTIEVNGVQYDMDIKVEHIDATTGNIYSDFRGWMSPSGELHPLYGVDGHTKLAKEILGYSGDNPIDALHKAGWVRVVCSNSFSCAKLDTNTRKLLLKIVLEQMSCERFFIEIGRKSLSMTRDEAIEYFSERND